MHTGSLVVVFQALFQVFIHAELLGTVLLHWLTNSMQATESGGRELYSSPGMLWLNLPSASKLQDIFNRLYIIQRPCVHSMHWAEGGADLTEHHTLSPSASAEQAAKALFEDVADLQQPCTIQYSMLLQLTTWTGE